MSKAGVSSSKVGDDLTKDEEFKKEYENLKLRYEMISAAIKVKQNKNKGN